MSLTLDENQAIYQIQAYQPGQIQINDRILYNSVIITSAKLIENWQPQHISALNHSHLETIIQLRPTILLLGTGSYLQFPPVEIYGDLINHKIGVEIMDTRAACRTYNALTAENRNVIAALIIL